MTKYHTPIKNTRVGLHYFPDTLHYKESDLNAWLPELKAIGAQWLTLIAPSDRAIPEGFIRGLIDAGIEPILHFPLTLKSHTKPDDLSLLFNVYAAWGVHYVVLFNRPNCHDEWSDGRWVQRDLVERFLDIFLPLSEAVCQAGMIPVFPPLEPGGDFWDTAFLRSALQGIQRRGNHRLLEVMVLGAYAWTNNLPLNWGAGGPERWAGARPYYTPKGEEDHIGFRIFDWYSTISEAELGEKLPILLLATGSLPGDQPDTKALETNKEEHAIRNLQLAKLLANDEEAAIDGEILEPVPENVLAGCFWLLAANPLHPEANHAWYQGDGTTSPVVEEFKAWNKARKDSREIRPKSSQSQSLKSTYHKSKSIKHYLLLPTYEWGVSNWHLDVTRPFIQKHLPAVGFSVEEASTADKVTVIGGEQSFPPEVIEKLQAAGCNVEQISGDGTSIATQLETL